MTQVAERVREWCITVPYSRDIHEAQEHLVGHDGVGSVRVESIGGTIKLTASKETANILREKYGYNIK